MSNKLRSIRMRLFLTISITIAVMIILLIIINNIILERFYIYSKEQRLLEGYQIINSYYNKNESINIKKELERLENNHNCEILITDMNNLTKYMTNSGFIPDYMGIVTKRQFLYNASLLYSGEKILINQAQDINTGYNFIYLTSTLDNEYKLYIRVPIASIKESVKISNSFLQLIGCCTAIVSGVIVIIISKRFTDPILQLNEVAQKMSKLDFSAKYKETNLNDEIDNLGKSINVMSNTMEKTIKQLRNTNIEIEKDIEEKSKTD